MRNLKFPEIEKKVQQSVYGAWGGSNSNDPNGGWYDNGDGITIIGNGGGGSSGGWDYGDNGSYDDGGYWGDYGGGGGSSYDFGDNFINSNSMLNFAQGHANYQESNEVEDKIRSAVNATGLAAGFTGTAMEAITAITKEIGFSAKAFGAVGSKIGAAGILIGGHEVIVAVTEASTGENPWDSADTLNAISTGLALFAVIIPGPHSIVLGGLSVMVGLVGTAYSNSN